MFTFITGFTQKAIQAFYPMKSKKFKNSILIT